MTEPPAPTDASSSAPAAPPQQQPESSSSPSSSPVQTIASAAAFAELLRTHTYVVVDFHATWCGPCKAVAPLFAAHASPGKLAFVSVDIDEVPEVARRYRVAAVPTFLFVKDGEEFEELKGPNPARLKREVEAVARELADAREGGNEVEKALGDEDW